MSKHRCDGCDRPISIAGSVANVWTFGDADGSAGTAVTLEFETGETALLCYSCLAALPEEPTPADLEALEATAGERSRQS